MVRFSSYFRLFARCVVVLDLSTMSPEANQKQLNLDGPSASVLLDATSLRSWLLRSILAIDMLPGSKYLPSVSEVDSLVIAFQSQTRIHDCLRRRV